MKRQLRLWMLGLIAIIASALLGQAYLQPSALARPLDPPGTLADAFEDQVATCVLVLAQEGKYEYDFKKFLEVCEQIVKEAEPQLYAAHIGSTVEAEKLKVLAPHCGLILGVALGAVDAAKAQVEAELKAASAALQSAATGSTTDYPAAYSRYQTAYAQAMSLRDDREVRRALMSAAVAQSLPPGIELADIQSACQAAFQAADEQGLAILALITIDPSFQLPSVPASCPTNSSAPSDSQTLGTVGDWQYLWASTALPDPVMGTVNEIGVFWDNVVASVAEWCPCGGNHGNGNKSDKKKNNGGDDDDDEDDDKEDNRKKNDNNDNEDEGPRQAPQVVAATPPSGTSRGC